MPEQKPDSETMRTRVTHGWAFTDLHPDVVESVKKYLEDGNPEHLEVTSYKNLRDHMYRRGER